MWELASAVTSTVPSGEQRLGPSPLREMPGVDRLWPMFEGMSKVGGAIQRIASIRTVRNQGVNWLIINVLATAL